jgi:hypothetical protein
MSERQYWITLACASHAASSRVGELGREVQVRSPCPIGEVGLRLVASAMQADLAECGVT